MHPTHQQLIHALQARTQGFNYTKPQLVNWLCSEFDISVQRSEQVVSEFILR